MDSFRPERDRGFGANASRFFRQSLYLASFDRELAARLTPFLGSRLLEVGCGVGNLTRFLLGRELVVAADIDPEYVRLVQASLGPRPDLECLCLDVTSDLGCVREHRLDSVLCSNVLEHVAADDAALQRIAELLPPGGRLVVVVPAGPVLFNRLDSSAGHFRRYTAAGLRGQLGRAGFDCRAVRPFNALGALGWLACGRLVRRPVIPDWQLRLFDRIAAPALKAESWLSLGVGLSLIAVAERKRARIARPSL